VIPRSARKQQPPATQMLVVSGLPRQSHGAVALRAEAVGYLRKDVDAEALRRAVRRTDWPVARAKVAARNLIGSEGEISSLRSPAAPSR
jgi:DNA-binding NarL/FixJ family response regulator